MSGSYRSGLNGGYGDPSWAKKLRQACDLIHEVTLEVYQCAGEEDQSDNAADDGGLAEKLSLAVRLIEEELPKPKEAPDVK
jgi:hypothetical protein